MANSAPFVTLQLDTGAVVKARPAADRDSDAMLFASDVLLTVTAVKTAAYTAKVREAVLADATAGAFNVTAPTPAAGATFLVKNVGGSNNVTVVHHAAETLDSGTLAPGDEGYFISNGTNWYRFGVGIVVTAPPSINVTAVKTSAYTATVLDAVLADATGGAFNVTAPAPTPGGTFWVKNVGSGNNVTVIHSGSETVDSGVLTPAQSSRFLSDGTNWYRF